MPKVGKHCFSTFKYRFRILLNLFPVSASLTKSPLTASSIFSRREQGCLDQKPSFMKLWRAVSLSAERLPRPSPYTCFDITSYFNCSDSEQFIQFPYFFPMIAVNHDMMVSRCAMDELLNVTDLYANRVSTILL
jgi:hypothetical protein